MITAEELLNKNIEPLQFIVEDIIPRGALGMLVSPSKFGKSYMCLQLGIAVAHGDLFLGKSTEHCAVYYLALEDSERRLQSRLVQLLGDDFALRIPYGLNFDVNVKNRQGQELTTDNGLIEYLEEYVKRFADTRLIIIDVLQKVKPPESRNRTAYDQDYETMGKLQNFAVTYDVTILLLHHTRKETGYKHSDDFADVLGSTALSGACDFLMKLNKDSRMDKEATLLVTGRDIEDGFISLQRADNGGWLAVGNGQDLKAYKMRLEYESHPAIKTIKQKLSEAQEQLGVAIYEASPKELQEDVIEQEHEITWTSTKAMITSVKSMAYLLKEDGIKMKYLGNTSRGGSKGKRYQFTV